jgi:hypothetical protein
MLRTALFWYVTRLRLVIGYWRFRTAYRSHIQRASSLDCLIIEDGSDRVSRNVGKNYQSTLCNIPEERRFQIHCGGSLKSRLCAEGFEATA